MTERLGRVLVERGVPVGGEVVGDRGVVLGEPGQVAYGVLDDLVNRDTGRGGGCAAAGQVSPVDDLRRQAAGGDVVDHRDKAQDDGLAVASPGCGVSERRFADDAPDRVGDDGHRVLLRGDFEVPPGGAARPGRDEMAIDQA